MDDFSKQPSHASLEEESKEKNEEPAELGEEWTEDFVAQLQNNFASLLGNTNQSPSTIQEGLQRMTEAAQQILQNPGEIREGSDDFTSAITQTLQGLSEGTRNIQDPFTEENIMNMFSQNSEQNSLLPFMQGMLQSLMSKDVLYPSLKDILDKFPGWLQENVSKISPEDKERYEKQQQLIREVCTELESETENDTADQKQARFEKVLGLMQKLQDFGQPPTDLVGDVGPGLQFDPQGNPNQCSLC